jgi:uncharacterized membrane protein HdeD (DUF308 family)
MEKNDLVNNFRQIDDVRRSWSWFFILGLFLIALGVGIIGASYYATIFSIILLGIFLIAGGFIQIMQAFLARKWSGFFLSLLLGLLYLITGLLCLVRPAEIAITLTLWIAAFCFIAGLFRMLTSLFLRFEHWGWVFFNGLITFLLGWMIYASWPLAGLWVIGLFIGVDMILSGWSWLILSLHARSSLR